MTIPRQILSAVFVLFGTMSATAQQAADPEAGANLFEQQCKACHQIGEGAVNRIGPHLNDVFDRAAGGIEGFNYSKPMARMGADGLTWTLETLDAYAENPKALVSGTRMSYRGMPDAQDRANLLAYLRDWSAQPQNIPESAPTSVKTDPELSLETLGIQGDTDYGEYLASECQACHQADGSDLGIPSINGWPTEDFVVAMHAYKQKLRPHPAMQMMAGRLSDEEIAAVAAYFATLE